jgi:hypothetical protein
MKVFAQIKKVDEAKRLVYGRAAEEIVDRSGEIMDYASSKPHFIKWSEDISRDTEGKSLGNVRAMHGKVAAGKLVELDFVDSDKAVDVCAKIVDDGEWKKVMEGVYTGFSIGGSYIGEKKVEKLDGREVTRYTARPNELSLVDQPCIHTAKFFEIQKVDGSVEKVDFQEHDVEVRGTPEEIQELGRIMLDKGLAVSDLIKVVSGDEKKPDDEEDGDEKPTEKKDDEKPAEKKPDDEEDGDEKPTEKKDDEKPAEKKPDEKKDDEGAEKMHKVEVAKLRKGMYSCQNFAGVINSLVSLKRDAAYEAYVEGDKSTLPARIGAVIALAGEVFKEMIDEALRENTEGSEAPAEAVVELAAKAGDLAKYDGDKVKVLGFGARKEGVSDVNIQKMIGDAIEPLNKALSEAKLQIKKLEDMPAPTMIRLRAVSKSDDVGPGGLEKNSPPDPVVDSKGEQHDAATLIKSMHQMGGVPLLK